MQLGFYPGHWREVLEMAKLNFHHWLTCADAFPTQQAHLSGEAAECVAEAQAEYSEKGFSLGRGKCPPFNPQPLNLTPAL